MSSTNWLLPSPIRFRIRRKNRRRIRPELTSSHPLFEVRHHVETLHHLEGRGVEDVRRTVPVIADDDHVLQHRRTRRGADPAEIRHRSYGIVLRREHQEHA